MIQAFSYNEVTAKLNIQEEMSIMKKGTSYIVVAAMMMGLMLTGCGGSDNSDTTAASATTESVTEAQ